MMFNRFTDKSRKSAQAAFEESRMLGHDSVGDEDLLLGILSADEGIAAEALFAWCDARRRGRPPKRCSLAPLRSGSPSMRYAGRREMSSR